MFARLPLTLWHARLKCLPLPLHPAAITVEVTPAHGSKRQASLTSTVGSSKGCMPDGEAGVVLPFKPLAFTLRDVHYSVPFGKVGSGVYPLLWC